MPTVPGTVTPPIGTLPPSGLTPGVPPGVIAPMVVVPLAPSLASEQAAARLRPAGDCVVKPVMSDQDLVNCGATPPSGSLVQRSSTPAAAGAVTPPVMAALPSGGTVAAAPAGATRSAQAPAEFGGQAPITRGREFAEESPWNAWVDARYTGNSDHREGLDLQGNSGYLALGIDRRVGSDLIAGVQLSFLDSRTSGFSDLWQLESSGFNVGPYLAYRFSPQWTANASLLFGRSESENQIDAISGRNKTNTYSLNLSATGQYALGEGYQLRPTFSVYYSRADSADYELSGTIAGIPIALPVSGGTSNFGLAEAKAELNRSFRSSGGTPIVGYMELGVQYAFERPGDGKILTGDLTLASTSPWNGTLRAGARALVSRSTFLEASIGYLSIGSNDLNVWEGRLYLSHAF